MANEIATAMKRSAIEGAAARNLRLFVAMLTYSKPVKKPPAWLHESTAGVAMSKTTCSTSANRTIRTEV
jgi:hypothetical protein